MASSLCGIRVSSRRPVALVRLRVEPDLHIHGPRRRCQGRAAARSLHRGPTLA